jgi:hypothetical protein
MFCSQCGQEIPAGSQFCSKCGQPVVVQAGSQYSPVYPRSSSGMSGHLQLVAWFNIVFGSLGILVGIVFFGLFSLLGFGIPFLNRMDPQINQFPFRLFFPGLGALILVFLAVLSLPQLLGGIGLLKRHSWARILIILVSFIGLLHFPFGTILSIYSLWVLFSQGGEELFRKPAGR